MASVTSGLLDYVSHRPPHRSNSDVEVKDVIKVVQNNNAGLLKISMMKNHELIDRICSYKDPQTGMSMLRYSMKYEAYDVTSLLLEHVGNNLFLEKYEAESKTKCTTFVHLLIDEAKCHLIEKLLVTYKNNPLLQPYLELKKKCSVRISEQTAEYCEYMTCLEYAAFKGGRDILMTIVGLCPAVTNAEYNAILRYTIISKNYETFSWLLETLRHMGDWYSWNNLQLAMTHAVQSGFSEAVWKCFYCLRAFDSKRTKRVLTEFLFSALVEKTDNIATQLLAWGAREDDSLFGEQSILLIAVGNGLQSTVSKLADLIRRPKRKKHFLRSHNDIANSLLLAANNNHIEIVTLIFHIIRDNNVEIPEKFWEIMARKDDSFCAAVFSSFNEVFDSKSIIVLSEGSLNSAFHTAASYNSIASVNFFRKHKVNCEIVDRNKNTPLHSASTVHATNVVENLLWHGANVNAANKSRQTPLHLACQSPSGSLETIRLLLLNGCDTRLCDENKNTALHCFVQRLQNIDEDKQQVLELLCNACYESGSLDFINNKEQTAFDILLDAGLESGIKYFVKSEINIKRTITSALFQYRTKPDIIKILLHSFEGETAGGALIKELSKSTLHTFPVAIYDDCTKATALHIFAYMRNKALVMKLILKGADVLAKDGNGNTTLHVLASLSVNDKENENAYVNIADTILTSYLRVVYSLQKKALDAREQCHVMFLVLTRIFVNKCHRSVINHAAFSGAVNYLNFLLQFKVYLVDNSTSDHQEDNVVLDCSRDITALCLETMPSLNYYNLIWNSKNFSSLQFYQEHNSQFQLVEYSHLTDSQSPLIEHSGVVFKKNTINEELKEFLLEVIVNLPKQSESNCVQMLELEPIGQVIADYSRSYFRLYRFLLCIHLLLIIFLSFGTHQTGDCEKRHVPSLVIGVLTWMYAFTIMILRFIRAVYSCYHWNYFTHTDRLWVCLNAAYGALFAAMTFSWWLSVVMCSTLQPYFLSLSLAIGWTSVLSYMQAVRQLHVFINILMAIIAKDVTWFALVFSVFVMAMWRSLHAVVVYPPQLYNNVSLLYQAMYLTMNLDNFLDTSSSPEDDNRVLMIQFVYVLMVWVTNVILLNVLIAMMNDRYKRVVDREHLSWTVQSLRETIHLKRVFPGVFTLGPLRSWFLGETIYFYDSRVNVYYIESSISAGGHQTKMKIEKDIAFNTVIGQIKDLKVGIDEIRSQLSRAEDFHVRMNKLEQKLNLLLKMQTDPTLALGIRAADQWKAASNIDTT